MTNTYRKISLLAMTTAVVGAIFVAVGHPQSATLPVAAEGPLPGQTRVFLKDDTGEALLNTDFLVSYDAVVDASLTKITAVSEPDYFWYVDIENTSLSIIDAANHTLTIKVNDGSTVTSIGGIAYQPNHYIDVTKSGSYALSSTLFTASGFKTKLSSYSTCSSEVVSGFNGVPTLKYLYYANLSTQYGGELEAFDLDSTALSDYAYADYVANGGVYGGLSKGSSVVALDKWNYMQEMYKALNPSYVPTYAGDLTGITVGSTGISNFNRHRSYYYVLLNRGTTVVPTINVSKFVSAATTNIVYPANLPGLATITVGTGDVARVYTVYLDVIAANRLMIYYPDTTFEGTTTAVMQNWSTYLSVTASTEKSNGGSRSIKFANGGAAGWFGFDLAGGADYPARGDTLKAGVWVYGLAVGDVTLEIYSKETQGQIANLVHTITPQEVGRWVYIETANSTPVAMDAGYAQIVVKNYSLGSVYFDDFSLFRI